MSNWWDKEQVPEKVKIFNVDTKKYVDAEVSSISPFRATVYIAGERIVLMRDKLSVPYVAHKFGMQLTYTPEE